MASFDLRRRWPFVATLLDAFAAGRSAGGSSLPGVDGARPVVDRVTLPLIVLAGGIMGVAALFQAGWIAEEEVLAEQARVVVVSHAASQVAERLMPLRRLAELGPVVAAGPDTADLGRIVAGVEEGSGILRDVGVYSPDGRLLAGDHHRVAADRPDLLVVGRGEGPPVSFRRSRQGVDMMEAVAVARDLPETGRVIAVAFIDPSTDTSSEGTDWRLVLADGTHVPMPSAFVPPNLPAAAAHRLHAAIGGVLPWGHVASWRFVAEVPGTDAQLAVTDATAGPGRALTGAQAIGGLGLFVALVAGGLLLRRLSRNLGRLRAAQEREARVQRALAAIAQDARTPLGSIQGFAALLSETDLQPEQAEWAERIQSAAQTLNMLMDSLIEIGEPPQRSSDMNIGATRPDLVVRDVVNLFVNETQDRALEILTRVDNAAIEYFELDEKKIRRILYQLLSNAVKYAANGVIHVKVSVQESSGDDPSWSHLLIVKVEDSGPGIPAEDRAIIFEKFRRGGGREISSDGLGLGLFVARRLARMIGGDIVHDDRPGGGSVFTVTLPTRQAQLLPTRLALRGRMALLVGFDAAQRARLAASLHRLGLVVEMAPDGFLGLGMAERMATTRGELDVVVVDDGLTGMPAEVFLRRLRSLAMFAELPAILGLRKDRQPRTEAGAFSATIQEDTPLPELETTLVRTLGIEQEFGLSARRRFGRILVIEDNRVNRMLFTEILRRAGYSVFVATDAYAALNILERLVPDMIVLDIALPGMDGIELATRLRTMPNTRSIPLVAVTALDDAETLERARDAGIEDVLSKPLDGRRFLRLVSDALARERLRLRDEPPSSPGLDLDDEILINSHFLEAMFLDVGPSRTRMSLGDFIEQAGYHIPRVVELLTSSLPPTDLRFLEELRSMAQDLGAVQFEGELDGLLESLLRGDAATALSHAEAAERLWPPTRFALLRALARCEQRYERRGQGDDK